MRYLFLIFAPFLAFSQIVVHPISSYPDTNAPYDSMQFVAQGKPNSPVIYKKIYANQLRAWIGTGFDSTSCATTIDCDSTGTGKLVRQASPTITGILTNTGRDTTVGRGAWHGHLSSDSSLIVGGSLTSGAPVTGTSGAWKLGILVSAPCHQDTTKYIQLDISGTLYKLSTCQ